MQSVALTNASVKNRRMLIVDDEAALLETLSEHFAMMHFIVDCASEVEEAQALLDYRRYDVVLSDLRLSGALIVDGFAIVRQVRHASPNTKIIVLTGYSSPEVEEMAAQFKVDHLLCKPESLLRLSAIVETLLEDGN